MTPNDQGAPPETARAAAAIVDAGIIQEAAADITRAVDGVSAQLGAPGAVSQPAPVDYLAEAKNLIEFAHGLYVPLFPSLEKVYTPDVRARIAAAAAPVMQKYSFDLGAFFGRFGPEIGLVMVVVPLVPPTITAVRADRAARDAEKSTKPANDKIPLERQTGAIDNATAAPVASPLTQFPGLADAERPK